MAEKRQSLLVAPRSLQLKPPLSRSTVKSVSSSYGQASSIGAGESFCEESQSSKRISLVSDRSEHGLIGNDREGVGIVGVHGARTVTEVATLKESDNRPRGLPMPKVHRTVLDTDGTAGMVPYTGDAMKDIGLVRDCSTTAAGGVEKSETRNTSTRLPLVRGAKSRILSARTTPSLARSSSTPRLHPASNSDTTAGSGGLRDVTGGNGAEEGFSLLPSGQDRNLMFSTSNITVARSAADQPSSSNLTSRVSKSKVPNISRAVCSNVLERPNEIGVGTVPGLADSSTVVPSMKSAATVSNQIISSSGRIMTRSLELAPLRVSSASSLFKDGMSGLSTDSTEPAHSLVKSSIVQRSHGSTSNVPMPNRLRKTEVYPDISSKHTKGDCDELPNSVSKLPMLQPPKAKVPQALRLAEHGVNVQSMGLKSYTADIGRKGIAEPNKSKLPATNTSSCYLHSKLDQSVSMSKDESESDVVMNLTATSIRPSGAGIRLDHTFTVSASCTSDTSNSLRVLKNYSSEVHDDDVHDVEGEYLHNSHGSLASSLGILNDSDMYDTSLLGDSSRLSPGVSSIVHPAVSNTDFNNPRTSTCVNLHQTERFFLDEHEAEDEMSANVNRLLAELDAKVDVDLDDQSFELDAANERRLTLTNYAGTNPCDESDDRRLTLTSMQVGEECMGKHEEFSHICDDTWMKSSDCDDQLMADLSATRHKAVRPISMFSESSTDMGIVIDSDVPELDGVAGRRNHEVIDDRPISMMSTSSVDTGYQRDYESEVGTLTLNSPVHTQNFPISSANEVTSGSVLPGDQNGVGGQDQATDWGCAVVSDFCNVSGGHETTTMRVDSHLRTNGGGHVTTCGSLKSVDQDSADKIEDKMDDLANVVNNTNAVHVVADLISPGMDTGSGGTFNYDVGGGVINTATVEEMSGSQAASNEFVGAGTGSDDDLTPNCVGDSSLSSQLSVESNSICSVLEHDNTQAHAVSDQLVDTGAPSSEDVLSRSGQNSTLVLDVDSQIKMSQDNTPVKKEELGSGPTENVDESQDCASASETVLMEECSSGDVFTTQLGHVNLSGITEESSSMDVADDAMMPIDSTVSFATLKASGVSYDTEETIGVDSSQAPDEVAADHEAAACADVHMRDVDLPVDVLAHDSNSVTVSGKLSVDDCALAATGGDDCALASVDATVVKDSSQAVPLHAVHGARASPISAGKRTAVKTTSKTSLAQGDAHSSPASSSIKSVISGKTPQRGVTSSVVSRQHSLHDTSASSGASSTSSVSRRMSSLLSEETSEKKGEPVKTLSSSQRRPSYVRSQSSAINAPISTSTTAATNNEKQPKKSTAAQSKSGAVSGDVVPGVGSINRLTVSTAKEDVRRKSQAAVLAPTSTRPRPSLQTMRLNSSMSKAMISDHKTPSESNLVEAALRSAQLSRRTSTPHALPMGTLSTTASTAGSSKHSPDSSTRMSSASDLSGMLDTSGASSAFSGLGPGSATLKSSSSAASGKSFKRPAAVSSGKQPVTPRRKLSQADQMAKTSVGGNVSVAATKTVAKILPKRPSITEPAPSKTTGTTVTATRRGSAAAPSSDRPSAAGINKTTTAVKVEKTKPSSSSVTDGKKIEKGVLEARDRQLSAMSVELSARGTACQGLAVVVQYFLQQLESDVHSRTTANLAVELQEQLCKTNQQLDALTKQRDALIDEIQNVKQEEERAKDALRVAHRAELDVQQARLLTEHDAETKQAAEAHSSYISALKDSHMREIVELKLAHDGALANRDDAHHLVIDSLKQEQQCSVTELEKVHASQMEEITRRFEHIKFSLSEKLEYLRSECDDMRHREKMNHEAWHRDAELRLQAALAPYRHLPQEIESLRTVLDLRNQEIHELRHRNLDLQSELEELPVAKVTIQRLQHKVENLEAIINIRTDYEKQLSEKHQQLLRRYDREAKANKRLSMDKEELIWKLNQGSDTSITSTSSCHSPDILHHSGNGASASLSHSPPRPVTASIRNHSPPRSSTTLSHSPPRPASAFPSSSASSQGVTLRSSRASSSATATAIIEKGSENANRHVHASEFSASNSDTSVVVMRNRTTSLSMPVGAPSTDSLPLATDDPSLLFPGMADVSGKPAPLQRSGTYDLLELDGAVVDGNGL